MEISGLVSRVSGLSVDSVCFCSDNSLRVEGLSAEGFTTPQSWDATKVNFILVTRLGFVRKEWVVFSDRIWTIIVCKPLISRLKSRIYGSGRGSAFHPE